MSAPPRFASFTTDAGTRWRPWPHHAAVSKPGCTGKAGCRGAASRWNVCACGAVFAECGDHLRDLAAERAKHAATCAVAIAAEKDRGIPKR